MNNPARVPAVGFAQVLFGIFQIGRQCMIMSELWNTDVSYSYLVHCYITCCQTESRLGYPVDFTDHIMILFLAPTQPEKYMVKQRGCYFIVYAWQVNRQSHCY